MEVEFLDIDRRNGWNKIYQDIRNESSNFSYIIKDAKKSENKNLNRYRDVNPFDHSRVKLQRNEIDYINASLVNVESAGRSYILTQGPLPFTIGHFWLMIWEQKSKGILMLNRVIEKNTVKCHQYWPAGKESGSSDTLFLNDVNLKIKILEEKDLSHYTFRKFCLTDLESSESREVLQFHYTTWPDFGVPESPTSFLNFLFSVRECGILNSNVGPPIVHCSAGIGRSGTFCLIDSCLVLIEKKQDLNCINVRQQLLEMRHYRMGLIQTPDQLRFSYLAIIEGAKRLLTNKEMSNLLSEKENLSLAKDKCVLNENVALSEDENNVNMSSPLIAMSTSPNSDKKSVLSILDNLFGKFKQPKEYESDIFDVKQSNSEQNTNCLMEKLPNTYESNIVNQENNISTLNEASLNSLNNLEDERSGARKRTRIEREEKTAMMVKNIKKKQKESELWQKRKSVLKMSVGFVFIVGLGFFIYKFYLKS